MTRQEAIAHLENMKWLKGYSNTTVGDIPLVSIIDDIIALLKAQEPATIEPKRIELADETKAWLDEMDAVDALGNIANICIDWDGYRTADGLGGLINEIWAYAQYCAARLLKVQEPRVMTLEEVKRHDNQGGCVWFEQPTYNADAAFVRKEDFDIEVISPYLLGEPINHGYWTDGNYGKTWRCWTSRPTDEVRRATPWN